MKTFATYQLYQIMNENKGIKSYKDKNTFSAIVVYWDGSCYWVAELLGFFSQNSTSRQLLQLKLLMEWDHTLFIGHPTRFQLGR